MVYFKELTKLYIGFEFQQDNARIYKTPAVIAWFKRNQVTLFKHPPYSPDLNPIENVWSLLKNALNKRPRQSLGVGASIKSIDTFIKAIKEEWDLLS